jgi:hypothetical protein
LDPSRASTKDCSGKVTGLYIRMNFGAVRSKLYAAKLYAAKLYAAKLYAAKLSTRRRDSEVPST